LANEEIEVQAEGGTTVAEVCRNMGIAEATFYRWKQLYGGLMPSEVKKLRQLEEENSRLSWRLSHHSIARAAMRSIKSSKWKLVLKPLTARSLAVPAALHFHHAKASSSSSIFYFAQPDVRSVGGNRN
jgi:putative transposase